jgi:hypothetical protein
MSIIRQERGDVHPKTKYTGNFSPGGTESRDDLAVLKAIGSSNQQRSAVAHGYPLAIAKQLGKGGVTAAVVLNTIYLWAKSAKQPRYWSAAGRLCNRSIRQLANQLPYLTPTAIYKAVLRLEKAHLLEVDRSGDRNKSKYDRSLWFTLTKTALAQMEKKDITFEIEVAVRHGISEAALIANICYQRDKFKNPITDDGGISASARRI